MARRRRPNIGSPRPGGGRLCLPSRREVLISTGLAAAGGLLSGCDRFDASTWFSRGRYDVDRRFQESTEELPHPDPPPLRDPGGEDFSALVISDLHFFEREPNASMAEVAEYLEAHPVDLLFQLGDLADAGWAMEYESGLLTLESFGVPLYHALGNHDVYNTGWTQYRLYFGPSVYTLTVGRVLFVVTDVAGGTLGGLQRPWLEEQLAGVADHIEHVLILGHYPLWTTAEVGFGQMGSQQEVYDILDLMRRYGVSAHLSGHTHRWAYTELDGAGLYTVSAQKEASPDRSALRLEARGGELTLRRVEFPDWGQEDAE